MKVQFIPADAKNFLTAPEETSSGVFVASAPNDIFVVPNELIKVNLGFYIKPQADMIFEFMLIKKLAEGGGLLPQPKILCPAFIQTPVALLFKSLADDYIFIKKGDKIVQFFAVNIAKDFNVSVGSENANSFSRASAS